MKQFGMAWRNFGRSFVFFYEDFLLWILVILIQGLALVTVIFAPPVFAGLNVVANRRAEGKHSKFEHFWQGLRQHFWQSYKFLGIWAIVLVLLIFNIVFYFQYTAAPLRYLSFLWVSLALMWLTTLPYLFPMVLETVPPSLKNVFRNTFIVTFSHPVYTFSLLVQMLIAILLSLWVFTGILLLLPALIALTGNLGVSYLIRGRVSPDDVSIESS
jgi:uncharacterized membrane protein YesL